MKQIFEVVADPVTDITHLSEFLQRYPGTWVLTGAGISLGSGIPTYRDAAGVWLRSKPIQHQEFISVAEQRQRYWLRSMVGWRQFGNAQPNAAHRALAKLQRAGFVGTLVTQNVDGLHQRAGSENPIELHGCLERVICLDCKEQSDRQTLQKRLEALNAELAELTAKPLPDGDAELEEHWTAQVQVPACETCGGRLKPDVVFFGDTVPTDRVKKAFQRLEAAPAVLVIGSSLQVFSGFRFCRHAAEWAIPMGCINPGVTRADDLFQYRWAANCDELLVRAVMELCPSFQPTISASPTL